MSELAIAGALDDVDNADDDVAVEDGTSGSTGGPDAVEVMITIDGTPLFVADKVIIDVTTLWVDIDCGVDRTAILVEGGRRVEVGGTNNDDDASANVEKEVLV